jgi:MarR family
MTELQAFLGAVEALDAAITGHFGLERGDLRWFTILADAGAGVSAADIAEATGIPADEVAAKLARLQAVGHVQPVPDDARRMTLTSLARNSFAETHARSETAYVGLHRYGAEELGVVRTFLRVGRRFYERQTERFERAVHP